MHVKMQPIQKKKNIKTNTIRLTPPSCRSTSSRGMNFKEPSIFPIRLLLRIGFPKSPVSLDQFQLEQPEENFRDEISQSIVRTSATTINISEGFLVNKISYAQRPSSVKLRQAPKLLRVRPHLKSGVPIGFLSSCCLYSNVVSCRFQYLLKVADYPFFENK